VQLINDLLDVTKISQRKLTFQLQRVDAHEMLQYTMRMFTQAFSEKHLRTQLDLTAIDHFVMADSARLQQIYWNLIGNAIKFTQEGSVTIRSRNEWSGSVRKLHIAVTDTGKKFVYHVFLLRLRI
jgi:signal transduction histidine kinase